MTKTPHTPATFNIKAYNCPHCGAYARQNWAPLCAKHKTNIGHIFKEDISDAYVVFCECCHQVSFWYNEKLIYPDGNNIAPPNIDLNNEIKEDYEEAASIVNKSPRGAAALLRLAIQKLCIQILGKKVGKDIDESIKHLVKQGLNKTVQEALDSVRVIGNEAVHPGQIDLKDDIETVQTLFKLLNFIAEKMITEPNEVTNFFTQKVPQEKKEHINNRDGKISQKP